MGNESSCSPSLPAFSEKKELISWISLKLKPFIQQNTFLMCFIFFWEEMVLGFELSVSCL
jgi:hypothetical protein